MIPTEFKEANKVFVKPPDLDESQCKPLPAFCGQIKGGNLDGANVVVTAWKPNETELKQINEGKPIFLACIGGLPPHYICTNFEEAINL